MTGVEFLRRAKESCPTAIRMVLSGYSELQSITDAINEGSISKFLTKPWDDQLLAHVREALATKDLADECLRLQRELQRANAALAQSNAQLHALLGRKQADLEREEISLNVTREILEHMPLPVIGIDMDGMVAMANTAAEALFAAGASIMGAPACMVLPSTMLAMCEDERCATASFEQQGRRYTVLGRVMGERSESRGHLLFVMPGTP